MGYKDSQRNKSANRSEYKREYYLRNSPSRLCRDCGVGIGRYARRCPTCKAERRRPARYCQNCGCPVGKNLKWCHPCDARAKKERADARAARKRATVFPCVKCGRHRTGAAKSPVCRQCHIATGRLEAQCPKCGDIFRVWPRGASNRRKYCSKPECSPVRVARKKRPDRTPIACQWCAAAFTPRTLSQMFCGRLCQNNYKSRRRRFRERGLTPKPVSAATLQAQGINTCGICGDPVDASLKYPHVMSGTTDHIVPLSLGGSNDKSNLQLAHAQCNMRKGNRFNLDPIEAGIEA